MPSGLDFSPCFDGRCKDAWAFAKAPNDMDVASSDSDSGRDSASSSCHNWNQIDASMGKIITTTSSSLASDVSSASWSGGLTASLWFTFSDAESWKSPSDSSVESRLALTRLCSCVSKFFLLVDVIMKLFVFEFDVQEIQS